MICLEALIALLGTWLHLSPAAARSRPEASLPVCSSLHSDLHLGEAVPWLWAQDTALTFLW